MTAAIPPTPQEIKTAVENVGKLARWWKYLKGLFGRSAAAAPIVLVLLSMGCSTAQVATGSAIVGAIAGGIRILGSAPLPEPPGTATATPTPTPATPAPVETPPVPHGSACDAADPRDCDCLKYVAPNWMYHPCPTETPTPTPTVDPTPAPTASPTPTKPPNCAPPAPARPVKPTLTGAFGCPRGFNCFDAKGWRFAFVKTACNPGDTLAGWRDIAWHAEYDLKQGHADVTKEGWIYDAGGDGARMFDAYGRTTIDGETILSVVQANGEDVVYDHRYRGDCEPIVCAPPTPTPMGTPGPSPVPPPAGQPADFRLNFVNTCQALHYTKRLQDGRLRGECDGTYRFIGTLKSGERHGDACDTDHFGCAAKDCPNASADEIAKHRKTWELCGGRDWDSPMGVELHVEGAEFEKKQENPFQHYVYGDGSPLQIYGCLPRGARTHDGLVIPVNGDGCGGRKTVTWDEAQ